MLMTPYLILLWGSLGGKFCLTNSQISARLRAQILIDMKLLSTALAARSSATTLTSETRYAGCLAYYKARQRWKASVISIE